MTDLTGTVSVVTGGTSGIGLATAMALLRKGSNVVINARAEKADVIDKLRALAAPSGAGCVFVAGDAAGPETCEKIASTALDNFGRIDAIVHAAGGPAPGTILDLSPERWMEAFAVHVHSAFHLFRAMHGPLSARGGSVTFLSSAAALRGCPGTVAYQVVKASLIQLARALARDHAAENIRVNCVAPGIIRTPFQDGMSEAARENNLRNRIPLGREGRPEQVASLILQLVENGFITGETFTIDGGMSMRMV
ncbi:SDR family NAD(P)-dependent oxidoreductase [Rhizobium binxianense]